MLRAVLLDLDDTLLGNRAAETAALARLAPEIAAELPDVEHATFERRFHDRREHSYARVLSGEWDVPRYRREHLIDVLSPWGVPSEALLDRVGAVREDLPLQLRLAEGAQDLLDALRARGLRLGLLTNGPSELQRGKVARAGLEDHLDAIGVTGELGVAKPDPAAYARALELLGADPAETVMVGDSLANDVHGALAAGLAGAVWLRIDPDDERGAPSGVPVASALHEVPGALDRAFTMAG